MEDDADDGLEIEGVSDEDEPEIDAASDDRDIIVTLTEWSDTARVRVTEVSRWLLHVTTLAAGSIVVLATFAEKFRGQGPGGLLAAAAVGFAVTIGSGLLSSLSYVSAIGQSTRGGTQTMLAGGTVALMVTLVAFWAALACLAAFAVYAVT